MTEILPIPLLPGIRQDADRTMLPAGSLVAASGVSVRKGGIAKANGLVTAGVTPHAGSLAGPCDALGHAAGRQVAVMAGRAWARESTGDTWVEVGRASRARPVKAHWSAFNDASSGVIHSTCAAIGEYVASAHYDGVGVQIAITDSAGIRRSAAFESDRYRPRIFAVGSTFVLVYQDIGAVTVYARTINSTTFAVGSEVLVWNLISADDEWDAASFSSTLWLFAARDGATTFGASLFNLSLASTANRNTACASSTVLAATVYGTDGEGIWATFEQTGGQFICAFAEDLSSVTGTATGFASTNGGLQSVMTRRDATTVWLVWNELVSSPATHYLMRVGAYDTTAALSGGVVGYAWHVFPASRPWSSTTSVINMWVHTDAGTAPWATQRRYALATLSMDLDTPSAFGMFIEPEIIPDERANQQQSFHVPAVAFRVHTDEFGSVTQRGYFPALATIRTQNDTVLGGTALILYEWETEGGTEARSRQIAEVGGQGVIFGGGLQEIPSARINIAGIDTEARGVENGFLFSPAILSATETTGGSLTADALYQFVAVYEYVTVDGLRTRSAPSVIASATPSGTDLSITLEIASCPTTEREFSSPPNQTVIHIYATVGAGSTFHRITPDSGVTAGRGSITDGALTYVHNDADSTYRANEPLYTQGGVANQPAPAHRFGWTGGGYAWVGGLFNPQLIERSKLAVPNEPVQFTRQNSHRCLLPEPCTGGAWLDNVSIVFSLTGIYALPASLGAPQRLPSTVGCLDYRSVCELPMGIGFQSRRGYEILPRGFGQPQLISGPVEDSLRGRRVISATVTGHGGSAISAAARVGERHLVLFAIDLALSTDPGVRLVFDLDAGRWLSVDPAMDDAGFIGEHLTTWDGRLVAATRSGTFIRYQSPTDWGATEAVPVSITLADLRPFGVVNRGQVARVIVLGEYRSDTDITITAYQDGKYSKALTFQTPTQLVTGTAGDKFILEWGLPTRQVSALTLKIDCADPTGATAGEGVVIHAIGLEVDGLPGRPRTTQERTAA